VLIAIAGALGIVFSLDIESPGLHLLPSRGAIIGWYGVVAVWAALNIIAGLTLARLAKNPNWAGLHLAGDAVFLSVLLSLSGGAANPFTVLYFVPIMLATQVSPRWTWGVASSCLLLFGLLFFIGPVHAQPHGHHFSGHLKGMWFAFAVSGVVMTVFVHRIAVAIAAWREELYSLRAAAMRDRQLGRIGSLAAGAAHELGTPLGTMTVLLGELRTMNATERESAIEEIRSELFRCKDIVAAMANSELRVGSLSSADTEPWSVSEIDQDLTVEIACEFDSPPQISAPKSAVMRIVRELISNAESAGPESSVQLAIDADARFVSFTVTDDGPGMAKSVEQKATDPFFTTNEEGPHMGLGLFLAESQAHQLGGSLSIDSSVGVGTKVCLTVPRANPVQP